MAQGADKPLRRGSTWMFQWLGGQGVPIRNLSLSYCLGVGSCEIADLREDTLFDYKFACMSHNTLRGAAGGAVLLAELLAAKGYMD